MGHRGMSVVGHPFLPKVILSTKKTTENNTRPREKSGHIHYRSLGSLQNLITCISPHASPKTRTQYNLRFAATDRVTSVYIRRFPAASSHQRFRNLTNSQ